jgi:rhodanese-related sulfurtransferase
MKINFKASIIISCLSIIAVTSSLYLIGCREDDNDFRKVCEHPELNNNESEMIAEYLFKNGNPINNKSSFLIEADFLWENLNENTYVIDLRKKTEYDKIHIPGSIHLPESRLYYHFLMKTKPLMYERIVLVSETGQAASYSTSLLRALGFDNVFALKWGIGAWHYSKCEKWKAVVNTRSDISLNKEVNTLTITHPYPEIKTGQYWRKDMLNIRAKELLDIGFKKVEITANDVMNSEIRPLIIAYCEESDYLRAHLPGAVHFSAKGSLSWKGKLDLIDPQRQIAIYSNNGFDGAYACAYLRLLGYNAKNIAFGSHAFLAINKINPADAFSVKRLNQFVVSGTESVSLNNSRKYIPIRNNDKKPEIIKTKKEPKIIAPKVKMIEVEEEDEGGC